MLCQSLIDDLKSQPRKWLITGVAGFIGSNILEELLKFNQEVIGLDNFTTGSLGNLDDVQNSVSENQWNNFRFIKGSILDIECCRTVCDGVDYVLHHAALGSVPRSIADPIKTNANNIDGFLNILVAAKDAKVKRFVYAASSSTYGDHSDLPKIESRIGNPLSPYAVTKLVNELYANVFSSIYGIETIGLRYFNVFGKHQSPDGAYAAVIPKWIAALIAGDTVYINGDGETSRDFCYVENVIQANILAATAKKFGAINQIYNVAVGDQTTLRHLYELIVSTLELSIELPPKKIEFKDFRSGDVRHSLADIKKARALLGYKKPIKVEVGISKTISWYLDKLKKCDVCEKN